MAFSKITLNDDTLMDVTQDTVASSNLLSGETATGADGETVEGAIEIKQTGPTVVPTFNTSTGNIHIEATTESGYYDSNKTTTGNYTPAAIGIPTQGSKTVTPSESAQSAVTAGKYTTGEVTVGAISSTYVGSGITQRNADDMTASGASVTAPAGYYAESSSKAIATATQATPSVEINSSTGLVTATSAQAAGYVSGGTKTGTLQLSAQGAKTVTPSESSQTAVAAGKYTTGAVTVGAVSSTYVGSGIAKRSATDITADGAVVSVPAGYYASNGSKSVASGAATTPTTSITANPTMSVVFNSGKNLFDQSCLLDADGWQENDGDYYGQIRRVLETYPVGTGVPIYGEFKENTQYSVSLTVYIEGEQGTNNGLTVVAYYSDGTHANVCGALQNQTSWLRISGTTTSGKTVTSILISYSNGGVNVWHIKEAMIEEGATVSNYTPYVMQAIVAASVSASQSVTPTVSAGYVSSGTAGTVSVSGSATEQLLFEAKTVTPSNVTTVVTPGTASSLLTTILPSSWTHPSNRKMSNTSYDFSDFIDGKTYRITGYVSTLDSAGYAIGDSSLEIDETFDYAPSGEYYSYRIEIPWKNSNQYKYYIDIYKNTGTLSIINNYSYSSDGVFAEDDSFVTYNFYIYKVIPYNGLSKVTVNPIPSEYIIPTGTKTITENGTNIDVAQYESVDVNVSGGGGTTPASPKDVNFIDYDGTILYSYTKSEFAQLTALPPNPYHSGDEIPLTSQGWNWTLAQINAQLTAQPNDTVTVGQMYVTTDGKTYIEIELHEGRLSPYLRIAVNGTVVVDWGDNTATNTVTGSSLTSQIGTPHGYAAAGRYTISISVSSGSFAFYGTTTYFLLNKNSSTANENRVYSNAVQSVRIGNNASIGNYAFYFCHSLASITIPSGVTSIGSYAFQYCYSLASLTIPSEVTRVGVCAFYYCYSLASLTIPSEVTTIGGSAFGYCYSLAPLTIPSGITSIGNNTFYYCYSLSSLTIPSGVTSINGSAFYYCVSLASLTIPSGVTSIGNSAFNYCYGLAKLRFLPTTPPTVANSNAFTDIPADCVISVPTGSLSAYTSATNYPDSSTFTYIEE